MTTLERILYFCVGGGEVKKVCFWNLSGSIENSKIVEEGLIKNPASLDSLKAAAKRITGNGHL